MKETIAESLAAVEREREREYLFIGRGIRLLDQLCLQNANGKNIIK